MRIVTRSQLSKILRNLAPTNPRIATGSHSATPWDALAVADGTFPEYRLCIANARAGIPTRKGIVHETIFVGPGMRGLASLRYIPSRLSLVPRLYDNVLAPDVVIVQVSTRCCGMVSLGTEVNILPTVIEHTRARGGIIVAEINPHMPYTYGDGELSPDDIDYAIEVDRLLDAIPIPSVSGADLAIAEHVARLVQDGATLVPGIGAVPNGAMSLLPGDNYRIWTELLSDGCMALAKRDALDRTVPITASFAMGSQDLYEWLAHNPHVEMRRTEVTNSPANIAEQPKMTAIQGAIQADLYGQANATHIRGKVYSGLGGQPDFHIGAMHAQDGMSIIALHSWHPKANVSTIVNKLAEPTTTMQPHYIVTENGAATVAGAPEDEQAENIIAIADPRARVELIREHYYRPSIQEVA